MKSRFILIIFALTCLLQSPVQAAETDSKASPELKLPLESTYNTWRNAMTQKDLTAWTSTTASYRKMETRNRIISQRLQFPDSMFLMPLQAPPLEKLVFLNIFTKGDTATAIYFGKADFGLGASQNISDNFLVLKFIRETGQWKFDNLRIIKISSDSELLVNIRNQDFSFLQDPAFQPDGVVPIIPKPVKLPAYLAELWIAANGFEVTVNINNGTHTSHLKNDNGRYLVNGGLVRGQNAISLLITPIETKSTLPKRLEVGIYAAEAANKPAKRIFHYVPDPTKVPRSYSVNVTVR